MPRSSPPPDWVLTRRRAAGDQITAARRHAGLTQEQVALTTGIDRATYNRIELGHSSPLLDSLIGITDAIGAPLAELVREE
ncbi:helix-turn-helix domain-containing protein [Streptomyces sp. NPDC004838]